MPERETGESNHPWWQRPLQVTVIGVALTVLVGLVMNQSSSSGGDPDQPGTTLTSTSQSTDGSSTTTAPRPAVAFAAGRWLGLASGVNEKVQSSLQFTLENPLDPTIDPTDTNVEGELVFSDQTPVCTIPIYLTGVSITRGGYVFKAGSRCPDLVLDAILLTGTPDAPTLTIDTAAGPITTTLTPDTEGTSPADANPPTAFSAARWTGLATGVKGKAQSSLQFTLENPLDPTIDPTDTNVEGELVFSDQTPVCTIPIYLTGVSITRGGYVFKAGSRCPDLVLDAILLTGTPDAPTLTIDTASGPITSTLGR